MAVSATAPRSTARIRSRACRQRAAGQPVRAARREPAPDRSAPGGAHPAPRRPLSASAAQQALQRRRRAARAVRARAHARTSTPERVHLALARARATCRAPAGDDARPTSRACACRAAASARAARISATTCTQHPRRATSPSASARPAPARPISRWPARSRRCRRSACAASCWCARRSRRASGSGFLPGDLTQKVDPYLRPMYDALYEMMGFDRVARFIERNVIEVAPLAFMRGRIAQRLLHHPRRGAEHHRRADEDVPDAHRLRLAAPWSPATSRRPTCRPGRQSGLRHVIDVLRGGRGRRLHLLRRRSDVVRHPLVQRIVQAYEARGSGS